MMAGVAFSLLFPSLFLLTFFTVLLMVLEKKNFSLLNVYLTLVSFVSLIGLVVGFGAALQQVVSSKIITDEEWARNNQSWQLDQCSNSDWKASPTKPNEQVEVKKTDAQVAECKEKKVKEIAASRNYNIKDNAVTGIVWGTLFLIVFLAHYPRFVRSYRVTKEEAAA